MVLKQKWCIPHQILHRIALLSRPLVSMETQALRRAKWKVVSTHSDQCSVCPLQLFCQRLQFRQIFGQGKETNDMKDPQTKGLQFCLYQCFSVYTIFLCFCTLHFTVSYSKNHLSADLKRRSEKDLTRGRQRHLWSF